MSDVPLDLGSMRQGFGLLAIALLAHAMAPGARGQEARPPELPQSDEESRPQAQSELDASALEDGELDLEDKPLWPGIYVGPLRIGGALRFNYIYKDWDEDFNGAGEIAFDTARINLDLETEHLIGSFEYRYYRDKHSDNHDYSMIHHAWLGYRFDEQHQIQAGVTKVPFGILPFASHNWFFQLPYYVGLEDDYDLGLKFVHESGPWDFRAAYFFRDEGSYVGDSDDSARYSYDLVREDTEGNAERGQLNFRLAYTFEHFEDHSTELGFSTQLGRIPNRNTDDVGYHYAFAAHLDGHYGPWNLMLQALYYKYDVKNDPLLDASADGGFVTMGAYDAPYHVASEATILTAGLAYTVPVDWGVISSLTFYNDYSIMLKHHSGFDDTMQNVVGCLISADPFFIYIDVAAGRNHPWLGGDFTDGFADGGSEGGWHTRFNINFGIYF